MPKQRYHVRVADEYWIRQYPGWLTMGQVERTMIMERVMEEITEALDEDRHGSVFSNELIIITPITIPAPRIRVCRSAGKAFLNKQL